MSPRYWLILIAVLAALAAGLMFLSSPDAPEPAPAPAPELVAETRSPELLPTPAPPPADPEPPVEAPITVEPVRPAPIVLPGLDVSDGFIREQADVLSTHAAIDQWLATDQLVRKFTVMVEGLAQGDLPREPVAFLSPRERLAVIRQGDRLYLNPESYRRFDRVTGVIASVDPSQAVALLRLIEPLMQDAYAELGLRDVAVESRLAAAIDVLLQTPEPTDPVELTQPSVYYEFADPALEALAPAQKQLLRMGPDNARVIKRKLREVRALLALPAT